MTQGKLSLVNLVHLRLILRYLVRAARMKTTSTLLPGACIPERLCGTPAQMDCHLIKLITCHQVGPTTRLPKSWKP